MRVCYCVLLFYWDYNWVTCWLWFVFLCFVFMLRLCVDYVCLCIFGFCVLVLIVMCGYVRLIVGLCVVIVRT